MTDWKIVHEMLSSIAKKRAVLDADEAMWLRAAESCEIWHEFGMVNAIDYLERKLGYAPHTANERMRVARELGTLPVMERALRAGELHYSAVRELTRVAIETTDETWVEAARGKNLRQVEDLVAGKKKGDLPTDPGRPECVKQRVMLELSPEQVAMWREMRANLSDEVGRRLDDDGFVMALRDAALRDAGAGDDGRAAHQIAVTVCEVCERAWQDGGGKQIQIDDAAVECAECDAQRIGSLDGDHPARATHDIPPSIRRMVIRRAGNRCQVPGCRSGRGIQIHHMTHREHGGTHDPARLMAACSSCHAAHHRGTLRISGTAKDIVVERLHDPDAARSHMGLWDRRRELKLRLLDLGVPPKLAISVAQRVCFDTPDAAIGDLLRDAVVLIRSTWEATSAHVSAGP